MNTVLTNIVSQYLNTSFMCCFISYFSNHCQKYMTEPNFIVKDRRQLQKGKVNLDSQVIEQASMAKPWSCVGSMIMNRNQEMEHQ